MYLNATLLPLNTKASFLPSAKFKIYKKNLIENHTQMLFIRIKRLTNEDGVKSNSRKKGFTKYCPGTYVGLNLHYITPIVLHTVTKNNYQL